MSLEEGVELNITGVEWVSGYLLDLRFSDGESRMVDFEPFLVASSQPGIRKYLDLGQFKRFSLSYGNLVWNDYDLCFSIEDLYSGSLVADGALGGMVAEKAPEYGSGND